MMKKSRIAPSTWGVALAAIAAFVLVFLKSGNYSLFALNQTLIYSLCTLGLSVMLGMGGMMSFAGISFFGLGSYFVANMVTGRLGVTLDTSLALLLAPVFTALAAALIGLPLLRLRGTYFTFSTIGFVQVAFCIFTNYQPLFGGYNGISGIPSLTLLGYKLSGNRDWLLFLAAVVLLAAVAVERIRHSRLGRSLAAIRDNETAARTLGINVFRTKLWAFVIAAALCGFGGGLYALFARFISADCFTYLNGIPFIIMAMLGGINSTVGCIFGSVLVGMLPEWLRVLEKFMQLIYGSGVILLMIFMPMGINGLWTLVVKKVRARKKLRNKDSKEVEAK